MKAVANEHPALICTSLAMPDVLARLEKAAKRGQLPGFEPGGPAINGVVAAFQVDADAVPFEGVLVATLAEVPAAEGGEGATRLALHHRLKPRMPWIFFGVLVLTAYPGVLLTESMIRTIVPHWGWLWSTVWYWYFPLAVVSIPMALLPALKKSRAMAAVSGAEAADTLRKLLEHSPAAGVSRPEGSRGQPAA